MEEQNVLNQPDNTDLTYKNSKDINESTIESTIISQITEWSGPLPHPIVLKDFDNVIPNGADRIMSMIEREQKARIEFQKAHFEGQSKDRNKTLWFAFFIVLISIISTIICVYLGAHPSVSFVLAFTTPASIARAIIAQRKKNNKND